MNSADGIGAMEARIHRVGGYLIRYGLVVVIAWIGALKFTGSEATRIQQYIQHSPLTAGSTPCSACSCSPRCWARSRSSRRCSSL